VPRIKQTRALNYFAQQYKNQFMGVKEGEILDDMPPAMRDEFANHLYSQFIASVPIFRDLSQEILGSSSEISVAMCAKPAALSGALRQMRSAKRFSQ